ncbi:cartilage matrix protein-like isoform X2 [Mercenaria mercenaria]|uniref:cartilage matrix protein-like isoform X2 n=1 Tax=Mercenaria mercenaria TaxID=6596 RepID=UPI00234EB707|nr:cartilage matrix protein-like isoform X2 [Mercenaria mercenaria]
MLKEILFSLIYMVHAVSSQHVQQSAACHTKAFDIVFAIDTSSSIWKPDFALELKFIKDISQQFDIGLRHDQTRIGVVSFADHYYLQFHLWQNNRHDLVERALNRIRHRAGKKTNTASAIKYMVNTMFTPRYGSRRNAVHVAVIITDGKSQDRRKTIQTAALARKAGIHVFAIGVGDRVDYRELEETASRPTEEYVFEVDDFESLDNMKYILSNKTCTGPATDSPLVGRRRVSGLGLRPNFNLPRHERIQSLTRTPARTRLTTTTQSMKDVTIPIPDIQADIDPRLNVTNCGGKPADIYFALDASNSIWPEDFKKQLTFVRDLITLFDVSQTKTRVGLVTFSDRVKPIFDLNTLQIKENLFKQMENVTFMSGRTKTADALKFVHEQGFSPDVARPEVAHIMFVFTDGISKRPHETAREAELAKRDGIYMFSIGIGMSVEKTELRDIASDPDDDFVFHVSNFSVLDTIRNILAIKTCAIQPEDFVSDQKEIECNVNVPTDLMFVYDSAQLGIPRTRKITKFVYDVTAALNMDNHNLKVGRLLENCLSGADTYLSSQKPSMDFDGIDFPDFRRMIRKLASQGFAEPYGARRYAKKVAVLFLDDNMENLKQASEEIARLHETHTMVITIGDSDMYTAMSFSSRPANDYIVHVPSYKYLHTAKSTLLQKLCKVFVKEKH